MFLRREIAQLHFRAFDRNAANYGIIRSSREAHDAARGDSSENGLVAERRPLRRMFVRCSINATRRSYELRAMWRGGKVFRDRTVALRRNMNVLHQVVTATPFDDSRNRHRSRGSMGRLRERTMRQTGSRIAASVRTMAGIGR